jgi:hypothetical protein
MDGFAVQSEDTLKAREDRPVCLRLAGSVPMSSLPRLRVAQGEAAEVSTGCMMPPGAQAVVMIEYIQAEGDPFYGQARSRQLRPELCPWPRYGGPGAGRSLYPADVGEAAKRHNRGNNQISCGCISRVT